MKTFFLTFFLLLVVLVSFHCSIIAQSNPNLVPNGGFEQSSSVPSASTGDFNSDITWWDVAQYDGDNCQNTVHGAGIHPCGEADYVSISLDNGYTSANHCSSPSYPSSRFVSILSSSAAALFPGYCHHSVGIRVQLIKDGQPYSLVKGHTYRLKLKLRLGSRTSGSLMDNLMIHFAKFSTNWNANPNTSTNRKLSNATSFQLDPLAYDSCIFYPFERTFVVPEVCDGNEDCDYLQNMILYLDDNNSEIIASLSIDDVELYDDGCCIQYKQYENTSDLTALTHTSDYIRAGFDAGIIGTSGNVTVLTGQNVTFKAGNQIILEPGFSVQSGAVFNASIEDCNSSASTGGINVPFLPNVFTPNGDGINDNYCINVTGANQYHIQVFDSWGVLRFDYLDFIYSSWACLWDGRCNQGYPNCSSNNVPNGTYYYIITLYNCTGSIEYNGYIAIYGAKNMEVVSTNNPVSTNNSIFQNNSSDISIFPNPNSGKFQILLTTNNSLKRIHQITIFDIRGSKVWETLNTSNQLFEIDISSQPKGIYFVKIENEQGIKVEKIIYQ